VDPEPAGFDNPEAARWVVICESINQCLNKYPHGGKEIVRTTENHDAWSSFGRETKHIGEIQIEAHQDAVF
jgi:hypothetical protein